MTQIEIATGMARRFQKELGYRFAHPWPVFLREEERRVPFYLIHASDHPEAPKLMTRAFTAIYGDRAGTPVHSQKEMFGPTPDRA